MSATLGDTVVFAMVTGAAIMLGAFAFVVLDAVATAVWEWLER